MATLFAQIGMESKLFLRDRRSLFFTFAFPLIMVIIFGSAFGDQAVSGSTAINFLLPGITVMAVMMVAMSNNVVKIAADREKGIYRRLSLTPLKRQTLVTSQVIVRLLIVFASALLLAAVGITMFKANFSGNWLLAMAVLTIGSLTFTSLGFILSSLVGNASGAMPLCMAVLFPMMFLGGCFWNLDQLPSLMRQIASVLPTTHLNNALRLISQGAGPGQVWSELPVVLGWLAGSSVLAVKFFKWE